MGLEDVYSEDEFLTNVALLEIPCPCDADCINAKAAGEKGGIPTRRIGGCNAHAYHANVETLFNCILDWLLAFYKSWLGFNHPEYARIIGNHIHNFASLIRDDNYAEFRKMAFVRVIKAKKFHWCRDQLELRKIAIDTFPEVCNTVTRELYQENSEKL